MRFRGERGAAVRWLALLALLSAFAASGALLADADTERAQQTLLDRGFDPGPVDGIMGPRTRAAIEAFQRRRGLAPSGRLDDDTREALFTTPAGAPAVPEPAAATAPEPAVEPAPVIRGKKLLSFDTLGWEAPQGGPDALARFRENAGSPEMARSTEELIVPRGDGVYVVAAGERIPGFDCDPAKGSIEMELMLGLGGPIVFRALDDEGFCKLGFGVLLEVGQRIRMVEAAWGEDIIPGGMVEVASEGLRYLSVK